MMAKSFRILAGVDAKTALTRIERLLTIEGVGFEKMDFSIRSRSTPIAILGVQPVLYSRQNWFGLNPFVFISSISIIVRSKDDDRALLDVSIGRLRAYVLAMLWTLLAFIVGKAMPQPAGTLLFIGAAFAGWLGFVSFMAGYLVRNEVSRAVR